MENRIIEISRKKARNRPDKKFRADLKMKAAEPAFFARKDLYQPPKFPIDIKPERRGFSGDSSTLLIISGTGLEAKLRPLDLALPSAIVPKPAKPVAKRKPAAKKSSTSRVKAKTPKKAGPKKPRVKKASQPSPGTEALPIAATALVSPALLLPSTQAEAVPLHMVPTKAPPAEPTAPLPRANAVTLYRKNGLFDVLGYWLRTQISDISKLFRSRPKRIKRKPSVAQVLAENAALRQEIARLRLLQNS